MASLRFPLHRFPDLTDFVVGLVNVGADNKATTLADFTAYSKQIATVKPSGVQSASYSPSNSAQACPTLGKTWNAVSKLPPSPNEQICNCMVQNLTCKAKADITADVIKTNFDYICDPNNGNFCGAITADASTGVYGAFSMCNPVERLSKAFDTYYFSQPANANACDFKGAAVKQNPKPPASCQAAISQAGPAGTGVITSTPTGTGSGASGASGGSSPTSTKKSTAGSVAVPDFTFALLQLAVYVTIGALTGAGMVLL